MKQRSSFSRMAAGAIVATSLCLGAPWSIATAQNSSVPGGPVSAASVAQVPTLSPAASGVVKLYQAGIDKDIIENYINNTARPFHLNADAIIYLHNLGVPSAITQTMLERDGQLQASQEQYYRQQQMMGAMAAQNGAAESQSPAPVMTPATPAPDVTVIGSDYPAYDYSAYDYGYPYYGGVYYGWPAVGGWGWRGWGWGHGGFRGGVGGFHGGVGRAGFGGGFRGGVGGGGFHGGGGFAHGGGGFHGGGAHGGGGHR